MARKKEAEKAPNHERWLVSYADFITLLFAVFVTLYAMSQTDKKKVEQVAASYRSAFGMSSGTTSGKLEVLPKTDILPIPSIRQQPKNAEKSKADQGRPTRVQATKEDFKNIMIVLERYLVEHNAQDKVSIEITRRGLVISLKEAGFFDSASAVVKPSSHELLTKIVESIQPFDNQVSFEGHTDNIPIRSPVFHSNWELSTARATNLAHFVMDRPEVNPERIAVTGYGEYRPVADNATEEGRKQNRRVDIVLHGTSTNEVEETRSVEPSRVQTLHIPF
ncbi:MAG: OmpA family protein [Desulfobulbus sp.]|nr:OmpA family protein [Desulfobulbus sp.]